jgi:hypothetical protein
MPEIKKQVTTTRPPIQTSKSNGLQTTAPNIFEDAVAIQDLAVKGYKFLVFGDSGTGKTTIACDFPKPLFFIRPEEVEDGYKSVMDVKGVVTPPIPLTDPDQLSEIVEGQRRTQRYKTVVLDGVTCFQDLVIKKHMGYQDVPIKLTWGMVKQQEWGPINITLQTFLRDLLRLADQGTHIVLVAGERTIDGKSEIGIPKIMAAVTPASTDWIHKTCDYNVHTFTRQQSTTKEIEVGGKKQTMAVPGGRKEYCLHIEESTGLYGTKFRIPKGQARPEVIVDPTFMKLQALIEGKGVTK